MGTTKKESIWNRGFIMLFIINFCYQMGQQMMNTLVPKYANTFGVSATLVGLISSVFAIASIACRPFTSPALDSFRKKRMLMGVILLAIVVFVGYSFTTNIYAMIGFRLVHGVCIGVFSPLAMMMAGNALPESRLGSGIGVFALGQAIGQAVGPSIGLAISDKLGYPMAFRIGSLVLVLAFVLCFLLREEGTVRKPFRISFDRILDKDAVSVGLITMLLSISYSCVGSYLAIYGELRGVADIGLYFTVYAVALFITRPLSGILSDRLGFIPMIIAGIIGFGVSFFLVSLASSLAAFLLAAVVAAFGYGICQPQVQALTIRCVPKERRGVGSNTNFFFMDCGMLIGPVVAGSVIDWSTASGTTADANAYALMFRVMILPMAVALLYLLLSRRRITASMNNNQGK